MTTQELTKREKAIIRQAKCLGIDPAKLLSLPRDQMSAASYFPADPKALFMDKRYAKDPLNYPTRRSLRMRACTPPRATSKQSH